MLNKRETVVQPDVYEQICELVTTALLYEIPEHSPHHHILFTANQKLEQYRQAARNGISKGIKRRFAPFFNTT